MVFQDISKSFELNKTTQKSAASLQDRFFSFVIDYLVISPFVFFLLYFSFRSGFDFWRTHPNALENNRFVQILGICYVIYFSLIQSLFIKICSATPGQYFLKINIQLSDANMTGFFRVFFRQFTFWFSFLLLGIPFISMMTNKKRQTFYDRIGHISVVSRKVNSKKQSAFYTLDQEFNYWQSFMTTLIIFSGLLISLLIWKNYIEVIQRIASFKELQDQRFFCEELKNVKIDERLHVAVALNLVNQLSDECLNKEADFVLWKQDQLDSSLAYYAKSLTTQDAHTEKAYLKQACDGQNTQAQDSITFGCKVAKSFLDNEFEELYQELNAEEFLNDTLKYELSRILNKTNEIENNFSKLEKYNEIKLIKKYRIIEMITYNLTKKSDRSPAVFKNQDIISENESIIDLIGDL